MARDCPECASPCDGSTCRSCGWTEHGKSLGPRDPMRYLCHYEVRGQRCGNLGSFSPNTLGNPKGGEHPGPWYCWQHARHVHGETSLKPSRRTRPALVDFESVAERLAIQSDDAVAPIATGTGG